MADLRVHDGDLAVHERDPRVHDAAIRLFTMRRSARSRSRETRRQLKCRDEEATAAHLLFTLLDRYMNISTALTSNIKLSVWGWRASPASCAWKPEDAIKHLI
jgi:hypothetical protein